LVTPANCVCGRSNNIEHSLSCSNGAFPAIHYNGIQDLTADLLCEVCHDVSIEPSLQPLTGESLSLHTANFNANARLDIKATGFWGCWIQLTFFDVRILNPSNCSNPYRQNENLKHYWYEDRA